MCVYDISETLQGLAVWRGSTPQALVAGNGGRALCRMRGAAHLERPATAGMLGLWRHPRLALRCI